MSTKKDEKAMPAVVPEVKEDEYSIGELAMASNTVFGLEMECVIAALSGLGKQKFTVSEAKGIVEKFMKKEVK